MTSPKDVLALGQTIVRGLELCEGGVVLECWLAHHLAELMCKADRTVGPAKAALEHEAADIILKLWARRGELPAPAPSGDGYRNAIEVLAQSLPFFDLPPERTKAEIKVIHQNLAEEEQNQGPFP